MDLETSRLRAKRIALIAGFVPVVFASLLQPAPAGEVQFPSAPRQATISKSKTA